MEYINYDIDSFTYFKNDENETKYVLENDKALMKIATTSKDKTKETINFNFRLLNEKFPVPIKKIIVTSLEAFTENRGPLLKLKGSPTGENIVTATIFTLINTRKNYKAISFNSLLSISEANILLKESRHLELQFIFEDIEGNTFNVKNTIFFKELNLSKITYRKVSKSLTEITKNLKSK
jgi:hypothetical protein